MTQKQTHMAGFAQTHPKEYHCFCSKTYNSYAGLYLHLKTKHQTTFQKYKNMKISKLLKSSIKQNGTEIFKLKDQEYQQKKLKKIKTQHYDSEIKNKTLEQPIIKKSVENIYYNENYNNSANPYNSFPFHHIPKFQSQNHFPVHYGQYGQPWCPTPIGYPSFNQPSFQNYFQSPPNILQNFHTFPNFSQPINFRGVPQNNYPNVFNGWSINERCQLPSNNNINFKANTLEIQKNQIKFFQNEINLDIQEIQKEKRMFTTKPTLCQTPSDHLEQESPYLHTNRTVIQNQQKQLTKEINIKKTEDQEDKTQKFQQNQ